MPCFFSRKKNPERPIILGRSIPEEKSGARVLLGMVLKCLERTEKKTALFVGMGMGLIS